jgi:hypothetical protein
MWPFPARLLTLAVLSLSFPACAAPGDEDVSSGAGAMTGSPAESRGRAVVDSKKAYIQDINRAYDRAVAADFVELERGVGLVGDARSEFADVWRQCAGVRGGNQAVAHRWTTKAAKSVEDQAPIRRELFVVSTLDGQSRTIALAIYAENGAFVLGRKYSDWRNDFEVEDTSAFNEKLRRCRW